MSKVIIRSVNEIGIAYGDPIDPEACRDVADAVENAVIETDSDEDDVLVGGQRYRWHREG